MAITKKMAKKIDFVGEIFANCVFESVPHPDELNMNQKERAEWFDFNGFEWHVEVVKFGIPEYRIWCSNWKSILKQKMTKTEKRKNTICKHCTVYLRKDYGTGIKGDIYEAEFVFTNIYC